MTTDVYRGWRWLGSAPNLVPLAGPASVYKTYRLHSPRDAGVVTACKEAGCQAWAHGWSFELDPNTELDAMRLVYFRSGQSGRTFTEHARDNGNIVLKFEAFQRCFQEHRTRPTQALVLAGANRQTTGVLRRHIRTEDFVDDAATALDAMNQAKEKG